MESTSAISVVELRSLLAEAVPLIDVREPDEFLEVRVAEAVLVPLNQVVECVDVFARGSRCM